MISAYRNIFQAFMNHKIALFKPFLRLTTAPEAWEVRTRQQLPISFRAVIKKWKEEHNYKWTCEQLKVFSDF